jgi:hypothetical protein
MTTARKILLFATVMGSMLTAAMPAEAGRRTGTWKYYNPDAVWAYQQQQNEMAARQSWHARRHAWGEGGYGEGYGGGYGRPVYGRPVYGRPAHGWNGGYADQGEPAYGEYGEQGYPHRPAWDD